jgi:hypothetical protein
MKALFLACINGKAIGVTLKVKSQIKVLREQVDELSVILVDLTLEESYFNEEEQIHYIGFRETQELPPLMKRRYFRNFQKEYLFIKNTRRFNKVIKDKLFQLIKGCDLAYVRYLPQYLFLRKLGNKAKLIVEHNTNELAELEYRKDSHGENLKYYLEKFYSRFNLKNVFMGVAVSNEIAEIMNKRSKNYIGFVWNNPIDLTQFSLRDHNYNNESTYNLAVMIGSPAPWHGLDLLANAIRNYSGPESFKLYYIGNSTEEMKGELEGLNVEYCGVCNLEERLKIFAKCRGAIDSLAHFRINMDISPSLKSREYFAIGIPFVSGTKLSIDEEGNGVSDYYLNLNLKNDQIDMAKIVSFIDEKITNNSHSMKMHDIADKSFNMRTTFKNLLKLCAA